MTELKDSSSSEELRRKFLLMQGVLLKVKAVIDEFIESEFPIGDEVED